MSSDSNANLIDTLAESISSIHELQIQVTISRLSEESKSQILVHLESLEQNLKAQLTIAQKVYPTDSAQ